MKKIVCVIFSLFFLVNLSYASKKNRNSEKYIPKDGYTLLFAGQNNKDFDEFVEINKEVPTGFMIYTSLTDLDGLDDNVDVGNGDVSGKYLLEKYKGSAIQIGLYLVNSLDKVINGSLDEHIEYLADWIKEKKVPVYLRIGYEFDFPENNYDSELYKKAYVYIVDKFTKQKVKNVSYVWHSYAAFNPQGIERYYPGDDYVDWCAITYFANPQWIPMVNFAKQHNKPLMIAECSPTLGSDLKQEDKIKWYKTLFKFIENKNIKALCYINANWDEQPMFAQYNWGNCKLNVSEEIEKFWLENIKNERFITSKSKK